MADRVKTTRELKLVAAFSDGDDRTLAIPNPKSGLTKNDITSGTDGTALTNAAAAVLIGDKTGADFTTWKSAKVVEQTTVYLDLTTA